MFHCSYQFQGPSLDLFKQFQVFLTVRKIPELDAVFQQGHLLEQSRGAESSPLPCCPGCSWCNPGSYCLSGLRVLMAGSCRVFHQPSSSSPSQQACSQSLHPTCRCVRCCHPGTVQTYLFTHICSGRGRWSSFILLCCSTKSLLHTIHWSTCQVQGTPQGLVTHLSSCCLLHLFVLSVGFSQCFAGKLLHRA